jgi:hypothetical protein
MQITRIPAPSLFQPHASLSEAINSAIIQSEMEGGVYLADLVCGDRLEIETQDWLCIMTYCGDNEALVSGHPVFCPRPVRVIVNGSTWGGSLLKLYFIGRGMHLEFLHPVHQRIVTSPVCEIRMACQNQ